MNYLTEIKLFYDWLETHRLSTSAIALWHGLMFIANRAGWEEQLAVPMSRIETVTYMPATSIYRARKQLVDAGLLSIVEMGSNRASAYILASFEDGSAYRSDSRGDYRSANQYGGQSGRQCGDIYRLNETKLIQKEKKKKEKTGLDLWVSGLDSPWQELMRIWLEYKKSRGQTYKSEASAKACLSKLQNLSGNRADNAQAIIEQSMANNWAGLFPLRDAPTSAGARTPATGQRIGQIIQPKDDKQRAQILAKFGKK